MITLNRASIKKWTLRALIFGVSWFVLHTAMITIDGVTDTASATDPADAAFVLGNQVLPDGSPGTLLTGRLKKALEVYQLGETRKIVCSGGKSKEGLWEAEAMRDWLLARGVPADAILVDNNGKDTYSTALEGKKLFAANGWRKALIVSSVTHITRCKLAFRRFGIADLQTAHADVIRQDTADLTHEFFGYYYYLIRRY